MRHGAILRLLQDFELYVHQKIISGEKISGENISRHKQVMRNLQDGMYSGALHKTTLYALAFV